MRAIIAIAVAEFAKAFRPKVGTPSARDFAWLTIFFFLSALVVLLGWSARGGVWERFEQVLLGALPDTGSPIRVNAASLQRPERIVTSLIDQFHGTFPQLTLVPMRDYDGVIGLEGGGTIGLPGMVSYNVPMLPPASQRTSTAADTRPINFEEEDDKLKSWGRSAGENRSADLRILAVPLDAPIWQWAARRSKGHAPANEPLPMVIIASRDLFSRHFRYENYRKAVDQEIRVPCQLRATLPERVERPTDLEWLILEIGEGSDEEGRGRTSFHRFDIAWVDSFPLPEPVAFLIPLPTVEAAAAALGRPGLDIFLESRGRPTRRIYQLKLGNIDRPDFDKTVIEKFRNMGACLGAASTNPRTVVNSACGRLEPRAIQPNVAIVVPRFEENQDALFELVITASARHPLRVGDVAACAQGLAIPPPEQPRSEWLEVKYSEPSSRVEWRAPSRIEVPCSALLGIDHDKNKAVDVGNARRCEGRGIAWLSGYSDAIIYLDTESRTSKDANHATSKEGWPAAAGGLADANAQTVKDLGDAVQKILQWQPDGRPVFRLDSAYESALIRFGVLSTLVDKISWPIGIFLAVLYIALCYVILVTAFLHRRIQYGLLAMLGVTPRQLEYIVGIQVILGSLIGCITGYATYLVVVWAMNDFLSELDIIKQAALVIGLDVTSFFGRISILAIACVWFAMTGTSLAIANAILRIQGISTSEAPISLIKL